MGNNESFPPHLHFTYSILAPFSTSYVKLKLHFILVYFSSICFLYYFSFFFLISFSLLGHQIQATACNAYKKFAFFSYHNTLNNSLKKYFFSICFVQERSFCLHVFTLQHAQFVLYLVFAYYFRVENFCATINNILCIAGIDV